MVPDSQLLTYAKEGDNEAFSELVRRHQNFIFKFARGYLNDNEAAEDITQDVFIKAYQGLPYFKNESQFSSWLYKICKNHCLNQLRRRKLEGNTEIENVNHNDPDLSTKVKLKSIIGNLSDEYREIVILRYYEDLKYEQIARILNIPLSSVKIRLFRAKAELKKMIGSDK